MTNDAKASISSDNAAPPTKQRRKKNNKNRAKNLMLATDSAIDRLEVITRPGGEIENMDIKELKSLISSIRDLAAVASELSGDNNMISGVIVLPEVKSNE